MKEIKRVSAALRAVERWEKYLFRRALGMTFIVWAAVVAVAGFITLRAEPIAGAIGLDKRVFIGYTWLVAVVIAVPLTVCFFASAGRAVAKEIVSPAARRKYHLKGVAGMVTIIAAWAVLMSSAGYVGKYIGHATVWPLFLGIANVLTYIGARATDGGYPEQLLVGAMLVLVSPLIYALGTGDIAFLSMLAAIVLSHCAGGVYSLLAAPRALIEGRQAEGR